MLAYNYFRSLISESKLLGWSFFMFGFWLFAGAYLFGFSPSSDNYNLKYAATWFSVVALISGSLIGVSVANSVYHGSSALVYAFRFTRLKPVPYVSNMLAGSTATSVFVGIAGAVVAVLVFWARTGSEILPADIPLLILSYAMLTMFMFLLSVLLVLMVNNYLGIKNIAIATSIPQVLAYVFGLMQFSVSLPALMLYLSPFNEMLRLVYQGYSGQVSHVSIVTDSGVLLNPVILISALSLWIVVLFFITVYLIRRIRPTKPEEGRII